MRTGPAAQGAFYLNLVDIYCNGFQIIIIVITTYLVSVNILTLAIESPTGVPLRNPAG